MPTPPAASAFGRPLLPTPVEEGPARTGASGSGRSRPREPFHHLHEPRLRDELPGDNCIPASRVGLDPQVQHRRRPDSQLLRSWRCVAQSRWHVPNVRPSPRGVHGLRRGRKWERPTSRALAVSAHVLTFPQNERSQSRPPDPNRRVRLSSALRRGADALPKQFRWSSVRR